MYKQWEIRWSGFTLITEIWIIAVVNLILGVTLIICSISYTDIILSPEQVAPCTENPHLELARYLIKVLFLISSVGVIEATVSTSLLFAVHKRLTDLVMMWIIVYTCIISTITASIVVYCYILITEGSQNGDASTLLFLIFKDLYLLYSLSTCYAFYSCLKNRRHYISVSTIVSLNGFESSLPWQKPSNKAIPLMYNV